MVVPTSLKNPPPPNKKKATPNQLFRIWRTAREILGLLLLSVHPVFHRLSPVLPLVSPAVTSHQLQVERTGDRNVASQTRGGAAPRLLSRARALAKERERERERGRNAERELSISCRTRFIPSLVVERVLEGFFNHCFDIAVNFFWSFFASAAVPE